MRILLVDDDPMSLQITRRVLERSGHDVLTAPGGAEAIAAVRASGDDRSLIRLVISDWEMPEMTGPELCGALRDEYGRDLYFILLTGKGGSARFEGLYAGADDFLSKPLELSDLQGSIRTAELILGPADAQRRAV